MANVRLIFKGTKESETSDCNLECYCNDSDEIYLSIDSLGDYNSAHICLDKSTAIKLHRELKKQISFIDNPPF